MPLGERFLRSDRRYNFLPRVDQEGEEGEGGGMKNVKQKILMMKKAHEQQVLQTIYLLV